MDMVWRQFTCHTVVILCMKYSIVYLFILTGGVEASKFAASTFSTHLKEAAALSNKFDLEDILKKAMASTELGLQQLAKTVWHWQ